MTSAPASARRCDSPPLSVWGELSVVIASPTSASAASTAGPISARGTETFSRPKATSRPMVEATTPAPGSCSTNPTAPGTCWGGSPSTDTSPDSSPESAVSSRPAMPRNRVDLPDPLGPASSTRSPGSMVRLSPSSTGCVRP